MKQIAYVGPNYCNVRHAVLLSVWTRRRTRICIQWTVDSCI